MHGGGGGSDGVVSRSNLPSFTNLLLPGGQVFVTPALTDKYITSNMVAQCVCRAKVLREGWVHTRWTPLYCDVFPGISHFKSKTHSVTLVLCQLHSLSVTAYHESRRQVLEGGRDQELQSLSLTGRHGGGGGAPDF